jgi:hypothetical protein
MSDMTTKRAQFPMPGRGISSAAAIAVGCMVLAGCAAGTGTGAVSLNQGAVAGDHFGTSASNAMPTPEVASSPHTAFIPRASAPATARTSASASPRPAASPTSSSGNSATAGPASPPAAAPATCTNSQFTTSAQYGMWSLSPYYVYNDMWGIQGYQVSQTLHACSHSDWYVVADMNNGNGDGHVKTYPNAQWDTNGNPQITSYKSVTSSFAMSGTPAGIYEYAYDIWVNGLATSGSTEVMIWTYNHGQRPSGSVVANATLGGRSYQVWKNGSYIAFVADQGFASGTMDLRQFLQWIIGQGWLTNSATLSQVCYGVELVSTDNVPETFSFSNFSVNAG